MKKRIFIGFLVLATCLVAGGLYINYSIDQVITKLETIITLHEVEDLRKDLLTHVKSVQQDLLLEDSPHATDFDSIVTHVEDMTTQMEGCFDCHHEAHAQNKLEGLRREFYVYERALSRVYTTRANSARTQREKEIAFHIGQQIIGNVDGLIADATETLASRTEVARDNIAATKQFVSILLVAGPALGLAIALFFARDFTSSIGQLVAGTRRLKAGDLSHRIEGLHDEFGELGSSINEMAIALQETIRTIEESQKRYRVLFESAGDGIFILEAEGENAGRITSANRAAAEMHGYGVDELIGMNIMDLDTPEAAALAPGRIDKMLAGEWIDVEIEHRRRDGTVFPVEVSGGLLEFEGRKYILAFDRDITERKQAEEALQRAEQLVMVGEMAAGLAHEIKNPLAGIKVSIEVLATELELAEEDREVFRRITDEINRIETLLRNLLSYARPPVPNVVPLDVNKTVDASIKTAAFSLKGVSSDSALRKRKKIEFVRDFGDNLPRTVADASQLQQVMLNLLINAIYAIHESGTIEVKTWAGADGFIRIRVSDNGKGSEEPDLDRIFAPFFTTKPKGTGLGLAICKRLIEQQDGAISVRRNEDGGLSFTIMLPVERESGGQLT